MKFYLQQTQSLETSLQSVQEHCGTATLEVDSCSVHDAGGDKFYFVLYIYDWTAFIAATGCLEDLEAIRFITSLELAD